MPSNVSLETSQDDPTASTWLSASRIDWVKRRLRTDATMRPSSTRNVPSRVMPVIVEVIAWARLV